MILGLFTEFELKLVAGIRPSAFLITLVAYPILLTLSYVASGLFDRLAPTVWRGDVAHYLSAGFGGLAIEWMLLGNGPDSNAFQWGMFAMWTTFCFGPRVLTRSSARLANARRKFWIAFAVVGVLLTALLLMTPAANAKLVLAVVGLSGTYVVWSAWLLLLAWRTRDEGSPHR